MARISLAYPKINGSDKAPLDRCIAFEKYDGTNLHWVWDRDFGWHSFGMRRNRYNLDERGISEFNTNHPGCQEAPGLFNADLATELEELFREGYRFSCQEITVFTEFFGAESFAGRHKENDPKQLVLFDVETDEGILSPSEFVECFGGLNSARVVYEGKLTGQFIHDLRDGLHDVNEGVVCKGGSGEDLWMAKIKTKAYMERLKRSFLEDWEQYWE